MVPSWAPCWPRPRGRRELTVPGQSVEVHVDHLRTRAGRLYQFTGIDEATRYRVLTIYDHASNKPAIDFVEELRRRLPVAIQRMKVVCSRFLRGARHVPFLLGVFGVVGGGLTFGAPGLLVGAVFLVTLRHQRPSDHSSRHMFLWCPACSGDPRNVDASVPSTCVGAGPRPWWTTSRPPASTRAASAPSATARSGRSSPATMRRPGASTAGGTSLSSSGAGGGAGVTLLPSAPPRPPAAPLRPKDCRRARPPHPRLRRKGRLHERA